MDTRENLGMGVAVFRYVWGRGMVPNVILEPVDRVHLQNLRINVVFTDMQTTENALKRAVELAADLSAETRIIVPHVVPYPLALECPAVPLEFTCNRLTALAGSVGADPYIHVYLCRDVIDLLLKLLSPGSIVVIGEKTSWLFTTKAARIACALRKKGCAVILV